MNEIIERAKKIKLAIFDVDGVLTPGALFYGPEGAEYKEFHVHDGQGIKFLCRTGVQVAIITACHTQAIKQRMKDLGIEHVFQGVQNKLEVYENLKQKLNLADEQITYVGDDLPDLAIIRRVGLGITVPNAIHIMKKHAHWTTEKPGGHGAVREVCELIMQAQNTYNELVDSYL